ncbi:MAG: hypothetical protein F4Z63_10015 [Gammaproteobacteria bacterium]|nr:hypothetical protein [Gammaproteobacteria bacterium]
MAGSNVGMKWIKQDAAHVQRFVNSVQSRIASGGATVDTHASSITNGPAQPRDSIPAPAITRQRATAAAITEPEFVPLPSGSSVDSTRETLIEEINQLAIIPCILYALKEEPELTELMSQTEAIDLMLNGQKGVWDIARMTILEELD